VTDEQDAPPSAAPRAGFTKLFTPSPEAELSDPEIRYRMRTLDATERKFGFGAAGLSLLVSLLYLPSLLHNTKRQVTNPKPDQAQCLSLGDVWSATGKLCYHVYHPSEFALGFGLLVAIGATLLFAVWRSMRALTIFTAIFMGLAATLVTSIFGIIPIALGVWLLTRSWRLQRYGTKDGKESRKLATERAAERRATKREPKAAATGATTTAVRTTVTPSKRYTPKAKPRRK
jgi:hypothetical protein